MKRASTTGLWSDASMIRQCARGTGKQSVLSALGMGRRGEVCKANHTSNLDAGDDSRPTDMFFLDINVQWKFEYGILWMHLRQRV